MDSAKDLPSRYDQSKEDDIYHLWENSGYFNPDTLVKDGIVRADAPVFSMVLPPPNVTGTLHMGHAEMLAIEDIMIRYHRMRGDRTLWIPGTDHAAIATQSKVEKILEKEGKRKNDLGREKFLEHVNEFAAKSRETITAQVRKMGSSVDWSREAFTLDAPRTLAVRSAFKKMYDAGLIYRGYKVVNWDPKGQTVISDDEIVYEERKAKMYTFRYSKDFPISISTTRPETKLGDTAVAVHPSDPRYAEFVGKEYNVSFCGVPLSIRVVADESVEKDFGTGALGVTPAHSMIDWEIAKRHGLPLKQVINEYAKMTVGQEGVLDKKTSEAREAVVAWLKSEGLLEKEEDILQNVSTAERTGAIIEPLPKLQWFIDVNKKFTLERSNLQGIPAGSEASLKEIMQKTVKTGQINILPERFKSIYFHWIDNLRDWCVSRQIWYGHRIPVWYKGEEMFVGVEAPAEEGWTQDSDTLDTWFSSGLWTFSTLGWPEETTDLKIYHPTSVLETAEDILFFWVARMVLMTGFLLGEAPFHTVYLHSMVLNKEGKKMSKSSGHAIDPLDMIKEYGADAARLSLVVGSAPGGFIRLSEDKVRGYRNFSTKIWNVARFVFMNREENASQGPLTQKDEGYLQEFKEVHARVSAHIEKYEFHLAAELAYQYFWHTFADKIVEEIKTRLQANDASALRTVESILAGCLVMLHPFMPFVTESIYQHMLKENILPKDAPKLLMIHPWNKVG